MKKLALGVVAVLTIVAVGLSQVPRQSKLETGQTGRYQLFFGPHSRADMFLVDTQTGNVWRPLTVTGVAEQGISGNPQIWVHQDRLDSSTDLYEWVLAHTPRPLTEAAKPADAAPSATPDSTPATTPAPTPAPTPPQQ